MQLLQNLRALPGHYKGVLLDQFGVLHDGRRPYAGSVEALEYLHKQKLSVYLLSNSSQRSLTAYGRLEAMGFKREWITDIVTSGEITYQNLLHRDGKLWKNMGKRCMHFTWKSRGKVQLNGLNLQVVTEAADAEFILVHGTDALGVGLDADPIPHTFAQLTSKLQEFAKLDALPPMIVANPDFVTVDGTELKQMPGSFGRIYQDIGGKVLWMGKPGRMIYEAILNKSQLNPAQFIAIGDSLAHDIKGACEMGIDSIFIAGGVHADEVFLNGTQQVSLAALKQLCGQYGVQPKYYTDLFRK